MPHPCGAHFDVFVARACYSKKPNLKATFSYVGYEPSTDKVIVQYTNEANAKMIPASEYLKVAHNEQLVSARRASGRV